MKNYDVIIIGAGAAGLMCASEALKRHRKVLIVEGADKAGKKILISGGGRCNFTNLYIDPQAYISNNPHFCKSALSRYSAWDFMAMMDKHQLSWEEKTQGQLFCQQKSGAILQMLLDECKGAEWQLSAQVNSIAYEQAHYQLDTSAGRYQAPSLVIATGGASIPKMGASDFALQVAKWFDIGSIPFRPALVPFTFTQTDIDCYFKGLSGVALEVEVSSNNTTFRDQMLITHRGLSGPVILQISSYWQKSSAIELNLLPDMDAGAHLLELQQSRGKVQLKTILSELLPKRLAERLSGVLIAGISADQNLGSIGARDLQALGQQLNHWVLYPSGTEGMRTAEVCVGGVNTDEISSKTMETKHQSGLYFVGEALDVTGWLGGYNFQWAWASGWVAGQYV